jgi:hypothetical protein
MSDTAYRRRRLAIWMAAVILLSASSRASAQDDAALDAALDFFTHHDAAAIVGRVTPLRPAPVTAAERARVLATLPADGEVCSLSAAQREKLLALHRVLALHGREAVYVVKVVQVPQAVVALHARTVVLVSEPALDLLSPEELQALVAHEIGHEYFWTDYFQARRDEDRARLRTLELLCDGIAILTLRRAGVDPRELTSALERVDRYNHDRFGAALYEENYPGLETRRQLARRLIGWLDASDAP